MDDNKIFQVSVKGLFFKEGKLLMIQEEDGTWELPGGRAERGEDLIECLQRECREEMGLECEVLEQQPSIAYSALDQGGRARLMLFYKVRFSSLDFKPSEECINVQFFTKEEIKHLKKIVQLGRLTEFL